MALNFVPGPNGGIVPVSGNDMVVSDGRNFTLPGGRGINPSIGVGDYSVVTTVLPGNPIAGRRITGQSQATTPRIFEPSLAGLGVGSFQEAQLGDVMDIIDVGATPLAGNIVDVLLPTGVMMDLVYLCRIKSVNRYISMIPAGLWRFTNVSAAAVPAGTLLGFMHNASPQLLTN